MAPTKSPSDRFTARRVTVVLVAVALCALVVLPAANAYVYWPNGVTLGTIGRAQLDGSAVNQGFIAGADSPFGIAVDAAHVYWANDGLTSSIGRANLDGSSPNQTFIPGTTSADGVAVDGAHIYWTNNGNGTIGRPDVDGSNVNQAFISGILDPCGVAADSSFLYWANGGGGSPNAGTIGRSNLDGSGVNFSFITGATNPCGVAVDALPLPPAVPAPSPNPPVRAAITRLGLAPSSFRAAGRGGSIARKNTGARVRYLDSQPATTTLTVLRAARGVKRGGRCVRRRPRGPAGRPCTRYLSVGSFRHADTAGSNSFRFTGRVRRRKLRPGRYRLQAVPNLQGLDGTKATRNFKIVR
jgi:hypothetical protein